MAGLPKDRGRTEAALLAAAAERAGGAAPAAEVGAIARAGTRAAGPAGSLSALTVPALDPAGDVAFDGPVAGAICAMLAALAPYGLRRGAH